MIRILLFLGLSAIIEKSYGNEEIVNYLLQYGYLEPPKEGAPPNPFSADEFESALKNAQKFAGIPATGVFDNQTKGMLSARCGVPDTGSRLKRYVLSGRKWRTRRISYSFINYSTKLDRNKIESIVLKAFDTWARPTGLQFIRLHSKTADIQIGFFSGEHGDKNPFDGPGRVLAHAYPPGPGIGGDLHIDDDENWRTDESKRGGNSKSLLGTIVHELGHSLGLFHSKDPRSIMLAHYTEQTTLGKDDILGIQSIYNV